MLDASGHAATEEDNSDGQPLNSMKREDAAYSCLRRFEAMKTPLMERGLLERRRQADASNNAGIEQDLKDSSKEALSSMKQNASLDPAFSCPGETPRAASLRGILKPSSRFRVLVNSPGDVPREESNSDRPSSTMKREDAVFSCRAERERLVDVSVNAATDEDSLNGEPSSTMKRVDAGYSCLRRLEAMKTPLAAPHADRLRDLLERSARRHALGAAPNDTLSVGEERSRAAMCSSEVGVSCQETGTKIAATARCGG